MNKHSVPYLIFASLLCRLNLHIDTRKTYDGEVLKTETCNLCFKNLYLDDEDFFGTQ